MGAYGSPEHLPGENQEPQYQYGYDQYQSSYRPPKRHRKKWPIILLVSVIGFLVIMERYGAYLNAIGYNPTGGIAQANSPNAASIPALLNSKAQEPSKIDTDFISKTTYDKLKENMTYEEVVKLFGVEGKEIAESGNKGDKDFMAQYEWKNNNGQQLIELTFTGNKLSQKTEYGLE